MEDIPAIPTTTKHRRKNTESMAELEAAINYSAPRRFSVCGRYRVPSRSIVHAPPLPPGLEYHHNNNKKKASLSSKRSSIKRGERFSIDMEDALDLFQTRDRKSSTHQRQEINDIDRCVSMNNIVLDSKIPVLESRIIRMHVRKTEAPRKHCALVLDCGAGETKAVLLRYSQTRQGLYISQYDMMEMAMNKSSSSSSSSSDSDDDEEPKRKHHRQNQGRIHVEVVSEAPSMIDFIQHVDVRTLCSSINSLFHVSITSLSNYKKITRKSSIECKIDCYENSNTQTQVHYQDTKNRNVRILRSDLFIFWRNHLL